MKEYQLHGLRALAQSPKGTVPAFLQAPATQGAWRFHHALEDYGPTPLVRLNGLAEELGLGGVFVKDESHRFGLNAFKGLGGIYALSRAVARELGLDEFHAELLPGDKVDQVERLLAQKQKEQQDAINANRAGQVGTGDRSEKIRTYNFPQDRCTDHRIGLTVHNLDKIMDGNLDEIIDALATHEQAEKLRQLNAQAE